MNKPLKPKPQFYAYVFHDLQKIAADLGYNLVLHGSMNRDMDLVAIPWVNDPAPEVLLIQELDKFLRGISYEEVSAPRGYMFSELPGGRRSYVINLNRKRLWDGSANDEQYYLDISVTPLVKTE